MSTRSEPHPTRLPQNPLLTEPVAPLIRHIGVPVAIGAFFNTMYNVVDIYYGGLISSAVLAALSLSFPIFFVILALGFGLSAGNIALIGNALGGDKRDVAQRYAVQGILLGALLALLVTVAGLLAAPHLYRWMGADGDYLVSGLAYVNPIFYGAIFFVIVQMLNAVLNARGQTKPYRNFLVTGFLLNLLLDPWFIFGGFGVPAMGIAGIAYATVLVQILGCIYLGWTVLRSGFLTGAIVWQNLNLQPSMSRQILHQGLPNIIDLNSVSIGYFVLTYFVSRFGQNAVAALGIASRIEQVVLLPLIGLDVATLSLIAQNNGAQLAERVGAIFTTSWRYGLLIMSVGCLILLAFAPYLMGIFSQDRVIVATGVDYLRIKAWALFPSAFIFVSFAAMRGLKRPLDALLLSMIRMVFFPWAAIYLLVAQWGYGLYAIWWITAASAFLTGTIAYLHARRLLRRNAS